MPMEIKRQSIFKEVCTEVGSIVAEPPELGNCVTGFCIQLPLNLYTMTTDVIISVLLSYIASRGHYIKEDPCVCFEFV